MFEGSSCVESLLPFFVACGEVEGILIGCILIEYKTCHTSSFTWLPRANAKGSIRKVTYVWLDGSNG